MVVKTYCIPIGAPKEIAPKAFRKAPVKKKKKKNKALKNSQVTVKG